MQSHSSTAPGSGLERLRPERPIREGIFIHSGIHTHGEGGGEDNGRNSNHLICRRSTVRSGNRGSVGVLCLQSLQMVDSGHEMAHARSKVAITGFARQGQVCTKG